MSNHLYLLVTILTVAFPFIAMRWMWRRMKKTQRIVREQEQPAPRTEPWQETSDARDGLTGTVEYNPNPELMDLGQRSRQSHWPINNP